MSWWRRLTGRAEGPRRRVDPGTAASMQREGAILLDVREQSEWSAGRAPKARHIPLSQLGGRMRELPRDAAILTICRSGARSSRAAHQLRTAGFTVVNVSCGMSAWQRSGLPVVASGGRPGRVV